VLTPNSEYNGQKLTKLVNRKMTANASKTIAAVPVITFVKYNTAITAATSNLTILSVLPMFFFITLILR
jgi:hypothetical protein